MTNMPRVPYPYEHARWWLYHTGHYISRVHIDAEGAGTTVVIAPGGGQFAGKLWIVGQPKHLAGEITGTGGVGLDFDPSGSCTDMYRYEAVWLQENDTL